jgi:hypothetical protein
VGRTAGLCAVVAAVGLVAACGGKEAKPVEAVKPAPSAVAFQDQLIKVVRTVSPAVVQIRTNVGLGSVLSTTATATSSLTHMS